MYKAIEDCLLLNKSIKDNNLVGNLHGVMLVSFLKMESTLL